MRISEFDLIIAPPLEGANQGDWTRRWSAKLASARFVAPADAGERRLGAWSDAVVAAAAAARNPILFVGHGAGGAAIVHAAPQVTGFDVRGAFLVAPPDATALARVGPDWAAIPEAPLPWPSLVVASRSDPDGPFEAVADLAAAWGSELVDAGLAGRLDASSGHGPWPEGLMRLAAFLKIAARAGGARR